LNMVDVTEHLEIETYVEAQVQKIMATYPDDGVGTSFALKRMRVKYDHYYTWLIERLLKKSLEERRFAHRLKDGYFLPLISAHTMGEEVSRIDAFNVFAQVTTQEIIDTADALLWKGWGELSDFVSVSDLTTFEKYIRKKYVEAFRAAVSCRTFAPKYAVDISPSSPGEVARREKALKVATPAMEAQAIEEVGTAFASIAKRRPWRRAHRGSA
jgi:hypothetical protein